MQVQSGKVAKAQRVVIYGPEGIGKSTFAAQFPKAIFIDTEGSTDHLNVSKVNAPTCWNDIIAVIDWMLKDSPDYSTLVIDTVDWAEKLCIQHLCQTNKKKGIEDFGFGKGYIYLYEEFYRFIEKLNQLKNRGVNIVFTAHSIIKRFDLPEESGSYDRYELKLEKKITPLVKEWADMILFCNYKTYVVEVEGKRKAQGGQRVMFTSHTPNWDAKNRHNLKEELKMEYSEIAEHIQSPRIDNLAFLSELYTLMDRDGITREEVQALVVSNKMYNSDVPIDAYEEAFVRNKILKYWDKFKQAIIIGRTK